MTDIERKKVAGAHAWGGRARNLLLVAGPRQFEKKKRGNPF